MFPSALVFFLLIGLASAFTINVTTPIDWTTTGPNNFAFSISTAETTSVRYDLILLFPVSHPSRGIRQTLNLISDRPVKSSSASEKDHTSLQAFPVLGNHLLNVPDELPVGAGYVVEVRAHMDATKGRGFAGDPQTTFTEPFNVSKSAAPQSLIAATAATNGAGSDTRVGRLGAVLGFVVVVAAAVHAKSKLSPDMELRPKTWTSTGPNNVSYTLSSNGTDPLYYDVFLQTLVFSTGQTYTTLTRQNQPIANGQWINVTVFPGEMVNETRKELSYEESYSVRIEGHVRRNTTAEEGESQDWVESGPVNLTDPNAPSASATAKAGGSSSVMSFPSVAGPLMAIVGLLVAGGLSVV